MKPNNQLPPTQAVKPLNYESLYHALRSQRRVDPYVGMQLAEHRLPPFFKPSTFARKGTPAADTTENHPLTRLGDL